MYEIFTFVFLGAVLGCGIGIWIEKKSIHAILKIKSLDGTAEYIDGSFYYILNEKDYMRCVLNINDFDE